MTRPGYAAPRTSPGRVLLAIAVAAGLMAAAYVVAALLLTATVVAVPTLTLTGWFPWTAALVQAVPLYAGAWLAGTFGTRVAASAPLPPGALRMATVLAAPLAITVALAVMSPGAAWFATTMAVAVTVAGGVLGAMGRRAAPVRE